MNYKWLNVGGSDQIALYTYMKFKTKRKTLNGFWRSLLFLLEMFFIFDLYFSPPKRADTLAMEKLGKLH